MEINKETGEMSIENTHPAEIKRVQRKEIQDRIDGLKGRVTFSIVNLLLFLFVGVTILMMPNTLSSYYAIIPGVISLVFIVLTIVFIEHIKTEKITQRMLELFYEQNNL